MITLRPPSADRPSPNPSRAERLQTPRHRRRESRSGRCMSHATPSSSKRRAGIRPPAKANAGRRSVLPNPSRLGGTTLGLSPSLQQNVSVLPSSFVSIYQLSVTRPPGAGYRVPGRPYRLFLVLLLITGLRGRPHSGNFATGGERRHRRVCGASLTEPPFRNSRFCSNG